MIWSLVLWACDEHPLVDLHVVHHPVTCDVLTSMEVRQPLSRWNHMRLGIALELSLTRVGDVYLQLRPSQGKHVDAMVVVVMYGTVLSVSHLSRWPTVVGSTPWPWCDRVTRVASPLEPIELEPSPRLPRDGWNVPVAHASSTGCVAPIGETTADNLCFGPLGPKRILWRGARS
jgi:hypothetical protein